MEALWSDAALRGRLGWMFVLALLAALAVRLIGVTAPYQDQFVWRSVDNAAIARNFVSQGMDIRYPRVDWAGPEGFVETELPLQMFVVATLYEISGREIAWLGRLTTVLASLLMLVYFIRVSVALAGPRASLGALLVMSFTPTSVFFSRTFQQDALMLAAQMMALFHAGRWLLGDGVVRRRDPLLVALALGLGALVKPTSLLIGAPILMMALVRFGWRAFVKPSLYVVALAGLALPAIWYVHARDVYLQHGYTFGILSGGHDKFQWGRFLVQPYWYKVMLTRMVTWHLTPPGVALALVGAVLLTVRRFALRPVLFVWLLVMVGFVPLVPEGNLDMLYYQWMVVPPIAVLIGMAAEYLWLGGRWTRGLALLSFGVLLGSSFWIVRPSYAVTQVRHLELAEAIRRHIPKGALLVDVGAYDVHNPGGYNFDPIQFYYSEHKGWGMLEDELTPAGLERYVALGVTYLVTKEISMLERHPKFEAWLRSNYRVQYEAPGVLLVALEGGR